MWSTNLTELSSLVEKIQELTSTLHVLLLQEAAERLHTTAKLINHSSTLKVDIHDKHADAARAQVHLEALKAKIK